MCDVHKSILARTQYPFDESNSLPLLSNLKHQNFNNLEQIIDESPRAKRKKIIIDRNPQIML